MLTQHKFHFSLIVLALLAALLACNLPGRRATPAPTPIPVTTQAVEELATQVVQAASTAQAGGSMTLEMTEAQLTSAAALEMQNQGQDQLKDIQVRLRDGRMIISGAATQSGIDLPVTIAVAITVDAQGVPHSQVVEASAGPVPLPQSVVNEISNRFDQLLMQQLGATSQAVAVDSVTIADGKMTIVAHKR